MDRSVWKMAEALSIGSGGVVLEVSLLGKRRVRSRASVRSERVSIVSKSSCLFP